MSSSLNKKIKNIIETVDSILVIGDEIDLQQNNKNSTHLHVTSSEAFHIDGQYDLVLFNNILSKINDEKAKQLIALMRDQHSKQLLMLQSETSNWKTSDFVQMGMRQIVKFDSVTKTPDIWYFSLQTYKQVPAWLNNRFWANPELFDKYRW